MHSHVQDYALVVLQMPDLGGKLVLGAGDVYLLVYESAMQIHVL